MPFEATDSSRRRRRMLFEPRDPEEPPMDDSLPMHDSPSTISMNGATTDVVHGESEFEARQRFHRACGVDDPGESIELEIRNTEGGSWEPFRFQPELPFLLIGRNAACDIQLRHESIADRHAYLQLVGGRLACVDLSERNKGIHFLNERRWRNVGWLDAQQEIEVGPYAIRLTQQVAFRQSVADSEIDHIFSSRTNGDAVGRLRLSFLKGARAGSPLEITRPVTIIGRGSACKLKLADETVSTAHCSLLLSKEGAWVVDLRGPKQTTVDGHAVEFRSLEPGSQIEIGRFRLAVDEVNGEEHAGEHAIAESSKSQADAVPAGNGLSEGFVLSLMDQFSSLQRQMFAQMQQQTALLAQVFGAIQKDGEPLLQVSSEQLGFDPAAAPPPIVDNDDAVDAERSESED